MQIVAINHSRQPQKIWLKFDNDSLLPLRVDDLVILGIKKFIDIDSDFFKKIQESSAKFALTEYALRQIAISPKIAKLLTQKLKIYSHRLVQKYNYPRDLISNLIEIVVAEISQKNLLDEAAFIESYLRRHQKMSQLQLKYNLRALGLSYIPTSSDKEKIVKLLSSKISNLDLSDFKTKNKLIASLCRKGFAIDLVKTTIDELSKIS